MARHPAGCACTVCTFPNRRHGQRRHGEVRISSEGLGPDSTTTVGVAIDDDGHVCVAVQLLGRRFSVTSELARDLAEAMRTAADLADEAPMAYLARFAIDADRADAAEISRALARRRAEGST